MKSKTNKLMFKVWAFMMGFSCFILIFLFLMQIVLLNTFYERYKTKQLDNIASKLLSEEMPSNEYLEEIAYNDGICVSLYNNGKLEVISNIYNKGCVSGENLVHTESFSDFIEGESSQKTFLVTNPKFKNKTLIKSLKLGNSFAVLLSVSIEPLDASIVLLKSQYASIALVIFCLSLLVSYVISKLITKPIVEMSNSAREMAKGNYEVSFVPDSNIAEIKELASTLEHAKDEMSKTDELRRDLMANVGHDLKTPLTMIKAYAEMTRDFSSQSKEKRTENLNIIINETDKLTVLVNDILELSKVQTNAEQLNMEQFDLNELILEVIKRFDLFIKEEKYSIFYDDCKDSFVVADRKKIEQVIYNLLNNAINYTGNDKNVYVSLVNKKGLLKVSVKDTGKGINKKDIPYIWDKYYHNEKKHKRNAYGTGLGLSIVKSILENHGFNYGVESKKNNGTIFYFEIKLDSNKHKSKK